MLDLSILISSTRTIQHPALTQIFAFLRFKKKVDIIDNMAYSNLSCYLLSAGTLLDLAIEHERLRDSLNILYQINVIVLELFFTICYHAPMKNSNQVDPHFSVEKLKDRYLNCEHPKERTHWHIIWLLAQTDIPRTPREVAAIVGCSPDCVRKLRRRYNAHGEDALIDKRKTNGGKRCLDESQQQQLEIALSNPPPDGGLWTGPKVASWISEQIGRPVSTVTGWKYIKRLGFTLQTPRPRHQAAASPEAQAEVKKK